MARGIRNGVRRSRKPIAAGRFTMAEKRSGRGEFAVTQLSLSLTVLDFYDHYYQPAKHAGDLHRSTCAQYRIQIGNLNKYFRQDADRDVTLGDLCDELVAAAMNWLVVRGRERTTANKLRGHINALWNFAARQFKKKGLALDRPDNDAYRVDKSEPIAFLPEELDLILKACGRQRGLVGSVPAGTWWVAMALFVFSSALRINAARKVPTSNLDLVRGEVRVPARGQKQRKEQVLDLHVSTVTALRNLRLAERGVPTILGDWPYNTNTLRRYFARILVEAGIFPSVKMVPRELKFHALRKTLASQVFEKAGLHVACDRLGHSSVEVTKRYIDPRYKSQPRVRELVKDPLPTPPDARPPLTVYREEAG
jgi:integrase